MIEASFGTSNSNRIGIATLKLLSNANSSKLKESIATDKASGLKSFVYIEVNSDNIAARGTAGITKGWMLYNDGCFHHGTLFTADNGDSLFVADGNPYGDNVVGNEPKCMTYDEFEAFC